MTKDVFRLLKSENIADPKTVNSLFVSAYLHINHLNVQKSTFLTSFILPYNDSVLLKVMHSLGIDDGKFQIEDLVKLFEYVVSPADRIVTGAVYTPKIVRGTILKECMSNKKKNELRQIRIADISCGCGGFLMDAALWIHEKTGKSYSDIFKENIFGVDLQDYAIERTKILLSLLALSDGEDENYVFNLLNKDTLDFVSDKWDEKYTGFDIIVGNPPYVCSRNMSDQTRRKLAKYEVCTSGHPDLYIPFFQIATEMLVDGGILGYITMNTFLRSVNGRSLRKYFSKNSYEINIVDFRGYQIFESRSTYTCLFFMKKRNNTSTIHYAVDENGVLSDEVNYNIFSYETLDDEKGWNLNDYNATVMVETTGIQIKDFCPSRHGIATLSNDTYIFKPSDEDKSYFYLKSKERIFPIERRICRDVVNPNKLNSINDLDSLIEKVIFPYRIKAGKASVIEPNVMKKMYPCTWEYLNAKKEILLSRDKGKTLKYPQWYAFGRSQSLVLPRYKLFFPKFANRPLRCAICDDDKLMLYNGLAFVNTDKRKLQILKVVIESELFWNYIQKNGKPYSSGYYSLSGVDVKHFGIPNFSHEEEDELLMMKDKNEIEELLKTHYK